MREHIKAITRQLIKLINLSIVCGYVVKNPPENDTFFSHAMETRPTSDACRYSRSLADTLTGLIVCFVHQAKLHFLVRYFFSLPSSLRSLQRSYFANFKKNGVTFGAKTCRYDSSARMFFVSALACQNLSFINSIQNKMQLQSLSIGQPKAFLMIQPSF